MDIDDFRQSHLDLLSRSPNCSEGHVWIWRRFGQCLETTEQTLGFICGIVAVFLWTVAHVTIYKLQRISTRVERRCNTRIFLAFHWVSDVFGCVGAVLAQQLMSQIIFCLSAIFVNSVCCIHCMVAPLTGKQKRRRYVHRNRKFSPALRKLMKCLYPLVMLFPLISMMGITNSVSMTARDIEYLRFSQSYIPLFWVVGYTFGTMAGLLYCSAKLVEIFDSYRTTDCNVFIGFAYSSSILGEVTYVLSVYTQSQSLGFFIHSLPWTLPRLISAGLDLGIILQRCIQKRRTKGRRLSRQDTECLLSSDTDYADISSSGSEEVIWMPLKTVDAAIPLHPVTTSKIQFLSESDGFSDKTDYICEPVQGPLPETGDTSCNENEAESINPGKQEEEPLLADKSGTGRDIKKRNASADEVIDKNSEESQTNSESDDSTSEDGKEVLERQISNLNAVSSEEKIAVWIQSNSDSGEQSIKCSHDDA